jgi:hypothetical protein
VQRLSSYRNDGGNIFDTKINHDANIFHTDPLPQQSSKSE